MLRHARARNYISLSFKKNQMHQYRGPEPWIFKIEDNMRSLNEICSAHRRRDRNIIRNIKLDKIAKKYCNTNHKLCVC